MTDMDPWNAARTGTAACCSGHRIAVETETACAAGEGCNAVTVLLHEMAESLGAAIDAKDPCTRAHSEEVAVVSEMLALTMGVGHDLARVVHVAGHLHDIGKIGLPDAVLQKPGALSVAEWEMVRRHPVMGHDILQPVGCLRLSGVPRMVLHHHERWDGKGYPHKLAGHRIPLGARIIAVADSLSAMLQPRAYRAPLPFAEAAAEVRRCVNTQFDPRVVEAFTAVESRVAAYFAGRSAVSPSVAAARPVAAKPRPASAGTDMDVHLPGLALATGNSA